MRNQVDGSAETWRDRKEDAVPIGDILEELLVRLQVEFPGIKIIVVKAESTPA